MFSGVNSMTAIPYPPLFGCVNKAGSLPLDWVMLSHVLKRYYGPLRLPIRPSSISLPYTRRLVLLKHHRIGSPALHCLSSATCRPCYPGRPRRPIPFSGPGATAFPIRPLGRHLRYNARLPLGSLIVTACCFANWELTTPCYQDAAPLNYRGCHG